MHLGSGRNKNRSVRRVDVSILDTTGFCGPRCDSFFTGDVFNKQFGTEIQYSNWLTVLSKN